MSSCDVTGLSYGTASWWMNNPRGKIAKAKAIAKPSAKCQNVNPEYLSNRSPAKHIWRAMEESGGRVL